jgi:broad-specificity NMP kinase
VRICITGGPRTGKTTLAESTSSRALVHCDRYIDDPQFTTLPKDEQWSAISAHVASIIAAPGPYVIEGVQVARALRKALAARPDAKPCDRLIILNTPHVDLTAGQASMAKGVRTVLEEILPALRRLGVEIEERT